MTNARHSYKCCNAIIYKSIWTTTLNGMSFFNNKKHSLRESLQLLWNDLFSNDMMPKKISKTLQNIRPATFWQPAWTVRLKKLWIFVFLHMGLSIQEWTKQNLCKTAFKNLVKFFKVCLPQSLLGPFLNNLSHITVNHLVFTNASYSFK